MIDTHTHLYFREDYPDGGVGAVERALAEGVSHMVLPNVSLESAEQLLRLHRLAPAGSTSSAVGLHPEYVDRDWRAMTQAVFDRFSEESPVAIGEVGIDLYHDQTWRMEQMDAFGDHLDRARAMGLPVIIHSRNALDDTLHVIGLMGAERPKLLFHSFTADSEDARRIMSELPDALFGINGVVTFKNAPELREAVAELPLDRIVLETDAPYLAPVPRRGRTNESAYLRYINDKIAEIKGVAPEEVENATNSNATGFFALNKEYRS
ncbi:MAG: TatD family hydrolase [Muribaculaceae bacterium]|nr:TatD family hydrolase [Muribaculaceae bacterium]